MKKLYLAAMFVLLMVFVLQPLAQAQSSNPQQILVQYIADLQKNPNDNALREKIIRHVQTMRPDDLFP